MGGVLLGLFSTRTSHKSGPQQCYRSRTATPSAERPIGSRINVQSRRAARYRLGPAPLTQAIAIRAIPWSPPIDCSQHGVRMNGIVIDTKSSQGQLAGDQRPAIAHAQLIVRRSGTKFADSPLEGDGFKLSGSWSRDRQTVMGRPDGRLENGGGTVEEPKVRIRLPPAVSQTKCNTAVGQ